MKSFLLVPWCGTEWILFLWMFVMFGLKYQPNHTLCTIVCWGSVFQESFGTIEAGKIHSRSCRRFFFTFVGTNKSCRHGWRSSGPLGQAQVVFEPLFEPHEFYVCRNWLCFGAVAVRIPEMFLYVTCTWIVFCFHSF